MVDVCYSGLKRKALLSASTTQCFSHKLSTKDNLKLRWVERIASAHLPSANFIFEVTFPDVDAMRFEAVTRSIYYSEDSDDFMECCAVNEVMPFFSNVIYPGDILLRVNGQSLLRKSVNGEFIDPQKSSSCFENIASAATAAANAVPSSGVTIRFMRSGSTSMNFTPSPAELNLFQVDKHIAAKFNVVKVQHNALKQHATGLTATAATTAQKPQQWSIQLSFLDQQLPTSISQMMLGGVVTWGQTLLLSHNNAAALAQCTQAGLLAAGGGATVTGPTGPGAFLGPNGAPITSFSDSWVVPGVSLYTTPMETSARVVQSGGAPDSKLSGGSPIDNSVAKVVGALINATATALTSSVVVQEGSVESSGNSAMDVESDSDVLLMGTAEAPTVVSAGGEVRLVDLSTFSAGSNSGLSAAPGVGGLAGATGLSGNFAGVGVGAGGLFGSGSGPNKQIPRWAASLQVTLHSTQGKASVLQFILGRFEKEADAKLACSEAVLEVQETKQFRPKRFAKRFAAAYATSLSASVPQAQQQRQAPALGAAVGGGLNKIGSHQAMPPASKYNMPMHGGAYRPGGASASTGNMLNAALSSKVTSTGQPSCGFGSVAKVVVNLAAASSGLHGSGSSGNISAMNSHLHKPK